MSRLYAVASVPVKPHRRTPRPEAPFAAGLLTHTPADESWWLPNAPVQQARVWQDGPYLFELVERPEISKEHPDRFVLTTWCGGEMIERTGYGTERMAILAADLAADPMQFEEEATVEWSDDANGQFGYTRESV